MTEELHDLEQKAKHISEKLTDPSITPEEYATLSAEYVNTKRKISSLKVAIFMDGV